MNEKNKPVEDIRHIRQIMERSTTFVSLTGWSGIITGLVGLITFYVAASVFESSVLYFDMYKDLLIDSEQKYDLTILALSAMGISLVASFLLTLRRAKKNNQSIWDSASRKFALHLFIPLIVGGFFILAQTSSSYYEFVCSSMLIFFGMALLNASKYVKSGMLILAVVELLLGVAAAFYVNLGLIFWVFGFGTAILVYGILMYLKYER